MGRLLNPREGSYHAAELGEMGEAALAVEKRPAEFVLEQLYGARECRLRDVALLGRPGEIQLLGYGQEVSDLADLHCTLPPGRPSGATRVAGRSY